jgi:hypothetical protein
MEEVACKFLSKLAREDAEESELICLQGLIWYLIGKIVSHLDRLEGLEVLALRALVTKSVR